MSDNRRIMLSVGGIAAVVGLMVSGVFAYATTTSSLQSEDAHLNQRLDRIERVVQSNASTTQEIQVDVERLSTQISEVQARLDRATVYTTEDGGLVVQLRASTIGGEADGFTEMD